MVVTFSIAPTRRISCVAFRAKACDANATRGEHIKLKQFGRPASTDPTVWVLGPRDLGACPAKHGFPDTSIPQQTAGEATQACAPQVRYGTFLLFYFLCGKTMHERQGARTLAQQKPVAASGVVVDGGKAPR